jgi:hypothetical protein
MITDLAIDIVNSFLNDCREAGMCCGLKSDSSMGYKGYIRLPLQTTRISEDIIHARFLLYIIPAGETPLPIYEIYLERLNIALNIIKKCAEKNDLRMEQHNDYVTIVIDLGKVR